MDDRSIVDLSYAARLGKSPLAMIVPPYEQYFRSGINKRRSLLPDKGEQRRGGEVEVMESI